MSAIGIKGAIVKLTEAIAGGDKGTPALSTNSMSTVCGPEPSVNEMGVVSNLSTEEPPSTMYLMNPSPAEGVATTKFWMERVRFSFVVLGG